MSEKNLKEIPLESLETLRDLYKREWPKHIIMYSFINNLINKYKDNANYPDYRQKVNIFSLDGEIDRVGTFIAEMHKKSLILGSFRIENYETPKNLLKSMNMPIPRHLMYNQKAYTRRELVGFISCDLKRKILYDKETITMHLTKEDAMKFEIKAPKGFQIRSLTLDHVGLIESNWVHASKHGENFIEHSIKYNPNVGLYNQKNELVAWCLMYEFGSLMNLFTIPSHRRKGYATIVLKAMARKLAKLNCDSTALILPSNEESMKIFEKLGYKNIGKQFFVGYE